MSVSLDARFAEMWAPGGSTWDESAAMPWLADFECSFCGSVSGHEAGCPKANHVIKEVVMLGCKIEGCEEPAAATRGPYAKLCLTHAAAKKAERVAAKTPTPAALPVAAPDLGDALIRRVREVVGDDQVIEQEPSLHSETVRIVDEALEAAVVAAAYEFAELLRSRITDAVRGS